MLRNLMKADKSGKSNTRKALSTSILSLLFCVMMFSQSAYAESTAGHYWTSDTTIKAEETANMLPGLLAENNNTIEVKDLTDQAAETLVKKLLGSGVEFKNVKYTGKNTTAGTFTADPSIIGFNEGIILSTGSVHNVKGPNTDTGISEDNVLEGDWMLEKLIPGYTTYDATILEFDFIPNNAMLTFDYVFSSDEYDEYVGSDYNDVFGFFLNGKNIALVPNTSSAVSINNVNNGTEGYSPTNQQYFRPNSDGNINTEMDGLTKVLTVKAPVNVGKVNTIRLAIADAGDEVYDSNVFIKSASFSSIASDEVKFSQLYYNCSEDSGKANITVVRSGNLNGTVTVNYSISEGSAKEGEDYTPVKGTLTFPSGVSSKTFSVPIKEDTVKEGDETINLSLSDITGNAFIGDIQSSKLVISDNDSGNQVSGQLQWEQKKDVSPTKTFIVNFNIELDPSTVNKNNFYVKDLDGNILDSIDPVITHDNMSVMLQNSEDYILGETYYLYISKNVKSKEGVSLGRDIKMPFTIREDY